MADEDEGSLAARGCLAGRRQPLGARDWHGQRMISFMLLRFAITR